MFSLTSLPCYLLPEYAWAFKQWGRIPQAYILSKGKQKFGKGWPIVAFLDTMGRRFCHERIDLVSCAAKCESFGSVLLLPE